MLSLVIVFLVNDASGESRIAQDTGDGKLLKAASDKFGWIERLFRVRLLFSVAVLGPRWDIYGDRFPRSNKCLFLP